MKCLLPLLLAVGTSLASVCEQAPAGYGPVPTPDSASAFRADPILSSIAAAGATGTVGYHPAFSGLQAAINGPNYLGVYSLRRYDSEWCANKCDITKGCVAFNIYEQRGPQVTPNPDACPNPNSYTYYKCALWGSPISASQATNRGQKREQFEVAIAGSAGFNNETNPNPNSGVVGPWRWLNTGSNTPVSYAKALLNLTVASTSGSTSVQAHTVLPDIDPAFPHYVEAQAFKDAGTVNCWAGVTGWAQIAPGDSGGTLQREIAAPDNRIVFSVDCEQPAHGTVALTAIRAYRVDGNKQYTDTYI